MVIGSNTVGVNISSKLMTQQVVTERHTTIRTLQCLNNYGHKSYLVRFIVFLFTLNNTCVICSALSRLCFVL